MAGVTAQTRAMIRRVTAQYLTDRCTIERQHETPTNEYGDRGHAWQTVAVDVPCRLIYAAARTDSAIVERAAQEQMRDEYRLIVGVDAPLDADYRVTLTTGEVFEVVRIETLLTDRAFKAALLNRRV